MELYTLIDYSEYSAPFAAPATRIVDLVLAEVDRFSHGGPHDDDRVILIMKVL